MCTQHEFLFYIGGSAGARHDTEHRRGLFAISLFDQRQCMFDVHDDMGSFGKHDMDRSKNAEASSAPVCIGHQDTTIAGDQSLTTGDSCFYILKIVLAF